MKSSITTLAALAIASGAQAGDPTEPDRYPRRASTTTSFELNAVILGARPRAFINGQEVTEGDLFEGYQVTMLSTHEVLMTNRTRQFRLGIHPNSQNAITPLEVLK